ncbi:MAG: YeaH/YhbH family protein [Novipirellula sp. JB048]
MHVIDRRRNPNAKSLGNRQRFVRRVKSHIRKAVKEAIRHRKVADLQGSEQVSIHASDVSEPNFNFESGTGNRQYVLPGNRGYQRGDHIRKPGGGSGAGGAAGSSDGEGEDMFVFLLTREEFLDMFFDDLELPNLAKRKLKSMTTTSRARAGYSVDGAPQRLNLRQTMRRSLSRRIALGRPKQSDLEARLAELEQAQLEGDEEQIQRLTEQIAQLRRRMRRVSYLDTVDLRYNRFEQQSKPTTQAVMFCLMDTSASMTEDLKDLAKRFYMLLHLFLTRHYQAVEIVFIRHTYTASEVDEHTFFYGRETGGTVVSSALIEMQRIIQARYPVEDWNIYAAQASDGHNFDHDMPQTLALLEQSILPVCQYYAYIEVGDEGFGDDSVLWKHYTDLVPRYPHFEQAQVSEPAEIYPVFHKLFSSAKQSA